MGILGWNYEYYVMWNTHQPGLCIGNCDKVLMVIDLIETELEC